MRYAAFEINDLRGGINARCGTLGCVHTKTRDRDHSKLVDRLSGVRLWFLGTDDVVLQLFHLQGERRAGNEGVER